jgi:uncharacterized protein with FMN-binding domain
MFQSRLTIFCSALLTILLCGSPAAAEDLIELVTGAKVRGEVVDRNDKEVSVKQTISGRTFTRAYPLKSIAAITVDGKREVLSAPSGTTGATKTPSKTAVGDGNTRTKAEVEALINKLGRTPPDWFDATPLNYPATLDLAWPDRPQGPWSNQKHIGQYIWDIVNTNPGRWREGVRLMHHLLVLHKDDPAQQEKIKLKLAHMYHDLLEDYARAAFWLRSAGAENVDEYRNNAVLLAECYWRLGNRDMAVALANKIDPCMVLVKLWADMGETDKALQMAEVRLSQGVEPDLIYMAQADACRIAGRFKEAVGYYELVKNLPVPNGGPAQRINKNKNRARDAAEAIKLFELMDIARVPDGAYQASSQGYEGQLTVEVAVQSKRIESVKITKHSEKQYYSALTDTPRKIIEKQGVKGVDATSNATITSEAIINATAKALAKNAN